MSRYFALIVILSTFRALPPAIAADELPSAKPVPVMQAIPLPRSQASLQRDGTEIARFHFDREQERPFLFPVNGPAGRSLTRMGHPHDPVGHSHHNSVWLSHESIDGVDFWSDRRHGIIETQRILEYEDGDDAAAVTALIHWKATGTGKDKDGKPQTPRIVMIERRRIAIEPLPGGESLIIIDAQFSAPAKDAVTINPSGFGLIGVRMAKTIGVTDGGGTIRNSEGNIDEHGDNGCFRKPAKWCDYSGPIAKGKIEGITLLDHPSNINHPTPFHVRVDGWMGACLSLSGAIKIEPEKPLRLRYGLYVHGGLKSREAIEERWKAFAKTEIKALPEK